MSRNMNKGALKVGVELMPLSAPFDQHFVLGLWGLFVMTYKTCINAVLYNIQYKQSK